MTGCVLGVSGMGVYLCFEETSTTAFMEFKNRASKHFVIREVIKCQ